QILKRLEQEGYSVKVPADADSLRDMMIGGQQSGGSDQGREVSGHGSEISGQWSGAGGKRAIDSTAAVCPTAGAYWMDAREYNRLGPYGREIGQEWGPAPRRFDSHGPSL